jgi:hypothetical protein
VVKFDDKDILPFVSPVGKNGLDAETLYYSRKHYNLYSYPSDAGPEPIDMWNEKQHYGRLDENNNPVFLSEENLKPIPSSGRSAVFVADFVADAYKDMMQYFEDAIQTGVVCKDSLFNQLDPKRGWLNLKNEYRGLLNSDYDAFARTYSPLRLSKRKNKIKSFDLFAKEYINYLKKSKISVLLTKSKFITSTSVSPTISGLIIEFATDKHSDDPGKIDYIQDPSFSFYRHAARKFGFMVDKNAPWRIVADVKSPEMKKYMKVYGFTPENLFSYYYYKSYFFDLDYLKTHMVDVYNSYVSAYPVFQEKKIICEKVVTVSTERHPVTEDYVDQNYDLNFWLEKYIIIRNIEEKNKFTEARLSLIIKKAKKLNKHFDIYRALEYTNNNFKISSKKKEPKKTDY